MNLIKTCGTTLVIGFTLATLTMQSAQASDDSSTLQHISTNTDSMLTQLNALPAYIQNIATMAQSWMNADDSTNTLGNTQAALGLLTASYTAGAGAQADMSQDLSRQLLLGSPAKGALPTNANDLSYSIVLGQPLVTSKNAQPAAKDLDASLKKYIGNAAGVEIALAQPSPAWKNTTQDYQTYQHLYNTLAAIQSYDAYIISSFYNQQDKEKNTLYLTALASSSDWFTQIGSESLGLVLRHLLMFTSEMYVNTNRLLRLQEQQVHLQAMTNTLLIINNGQTVGQLLGMRAASAK